MPAIEGKQHVGVVAEAELTVRIFRDSLNAYDGPESAQFEAYQGLSLKVGTDCQIKISTHKLFPTILNCAKLATSLWIFPYSSSRSLKT